MNKAIKKKWLKALRSGQYVQGQYHLCTTNSVDKFCCLGVLCNVRAEVSEGLYWETNDYSDNLAFLGNPKFLSLSMITWAGLTMEEQGTLTRMNDTGSSFLKIAKYIERNL